MNQQWVSASFVLVELRQAVEKRREEDCLPEQMTAHDSKPICRL